MISNFKPYKGSEDSFQITVANYLNLLGVLWMHPANERKTSVISGAKLKAKGVKRGVPDILIFEANHGYNGLAIELKVGKNKLTTDQQMWEHKLRLLKWKTLCSNSLDEVVAAIENYLKN